MTAFDRRARVGSGEIGFIAVVVVEPKQPCPNFETSRALRKPAPIRAAPELPVSDDLEPERLLQTHNLADAVILNTRKLVFPNLLGSAALESFPQGWRTQQASDVVGAKRGPALRAHGHGSGQDNDVRACRKTAWSQDLRLADHRRLPALQLQKSRPSSFMNRASTMLCTSEVHS